MSDTCTDDAAATAGSGMRRAVRIVIVNLFFLAASIAMSLLFEVASDSGSVRDNSGCGCPRKAAIVRYDDQLVVTDPEEDDEVVGTIRYEHVDITSRGIVFKTHYRLRRGLSVMLMEPEMREATPAEVDAYRELVAAYFDSGGASRAEAAGVLLPDIHISRTYWWGIVGNGVALYPVLWLLWLVASRTYRAIRRCRQAARRRWAIENERCPACDYDMRLLAAKRCPECGETWTAEELEAA